MPDDTPSEPTPSFQQLTDEELERFFDEWEERELLLLLEREDQFRRTGNFHD